MKPFDCPPESELRSYLARTGEDPRSAAISEHLLGCRFCRLNLLQWQREDLQFTAPPQLTERALRISSHASVRSRQWNYPRWLPVAAAILIAFAVGGLWRYFYSPITNVTPVDPLRANNQRVPVLSGIAPADNAVISTKHIAFKWTTDGHAIRYTLLVLNASGDIVFQSATNESRMTLDLNQIKLRPTEKYFWHVRAKLTDGSEIETKPSGFTIQQH